VRPPSNGAGLFAHYAVGSISSGRCSGLPFVVGKADKPVSLSLPGGSPHLSAALTGASVGKLHGEDDFTALDFDA